MNMLADYANASTRAVVERHNQLVGASFAIPNAGCRAVPLSPPSSYGRPIVLLHEWPARRYFRNLLRRQRCYCGATTR